jgi:ribosomal-protein-alanine N-acetyltransferase
MNTTGNISLSGPADEDWEHIQHLDFLYFPRPWTSSDWSSLNMEHHQLFAWRQKVKLQGFALFGWVRGDDTAHLLKICLAPDIRGHGFGQAFWKELLPQLKAQGIMKVFLEVEETNSIAVSYYLKVGFETLRAVKGFYSDGTNGLMMIMTL